MSRSDDGADAGFAFGDGRESNTGRKQALSEKRLREGMRGFRIANHDRRDGCFAGASIEARLPKRFFEVRRIFPERLHPIRLLLQHVECSQTCGGYTWRMGGGEEEGPGAMVKKVDQITASANIA